MSLKFLVVQDVILWKARDLFVLRLMEMVSIYVWILFLYMHFESDIRYNACFDRSNVVF